MKYNEESNYIKLAQLLNRIKGSLVGSSIGAYAYGSLFASSSEAIETLLRDGYIMEAHKRNQMGLYYCITPLGYSIIDALSVSELVRAGIAPLWFNADRVRDELTEWPDGDRLAELHEFVTLAMKKYSGEPYETAYAYRALGEIDALRGNYEAAVEELRTSLSYSPGGGVHRMIEGLEEAIRNASV
jgi:hypothetical protein